ncbi:hypothetical protein SAMN04487941_1916 [Pontibacter akesuensis]|uniref:Uncharacterized protein n=2 Tax=Pontibacter akesuensis TaxID=388950 RepID=A0A1I7I4T1_9BACT|nr:hypothetical protein SAMN04487941_1916 [Pontibacter akesuensis]
MKIKTLCLLVLGLFLGYTGFAQNGNGRYFVQLQDGQIYYADKLQFKSPIFKSNYFLLDDSLQFNPSVVNIFQSEDGYFARVEAGKSYDSFAKRITDGPRIDRFFTTRTTYDRYGYSPYGYGYGGPNTSRRRIYFFSKDNGPLYLLEYDNLEMALADNASSMALLGRYKKDKLINTGISIVGAGLLAYGAFSSINNTEETLNGGTNINISPMMYAGAGILGAQLVINLFRKDKLTQAVEVYNYQIKQ